MFDVVAGFVYAQTLAAMVSLNLFERLRQAPADTATLANELGLENESVDVLMKAAQAVGLVDRRRAGWGLGLRGAALVGQGGIAEMVAHHHHLYADMADPVALLSPNAGPTRLGAFWTYAQGSSEAGDATPYSKLMAASQDFIASAVLHNRCFRNARHLLDLGGGAGAFGIAALRRHKNLTVTVADRADVVPLATEALAAAGLADRSSVAVVDFFQDDLSFKSDTISLVRILHDHDDDRVHTLLSRLARQSPQATLVIVEPLADPSAPTGLDAYFPWYFRAMGQGKLRTFEELSTLLGAAGYAPPKRAGSYNPTLTKCLTTRANSV